MAVWKYPAASGFNYDEWKAEIEDAYHNQQKARLESLIRVGSQVLEHGREELIPNRADMVSLIYGVTGKAVVKPEPVGMTDKEKVAMQCLVDFWNAYLALPDSKGSETTRTIMDAVHVIQGVLAIRVARRANPEIWR